MRIPKIYAVSAITLLLSMGLANAAGEPVVTNNVVIKQNTTAAQCPSNYDGSGGDATTENLSGRGESNAAVGPGTLSCTNCTFDPGTNNCTCATCYDYFDN